MGLGLGARGRAFRLSLVSPGSGAGAGGPCRRRRGWFGVGEGGESAGDTGKGLLKGRPGVSQETGGMECDGGRDLKLRFLARIHGFLGLPELHFLKWTGSNGV